VDSRGNLFIGVKDDLFDGIHAGVREVHAATGLMTTVAGFQSDGTVNFNLAKTTDMTGPEKLAHLPAVLGGGGQAPIRVQTHGGTGASILMAHVTLTVTSTPSLKAPVG